MRTIATTILADLLDILKQKIKNNLIIVTQNFWRGGHFSHIFSNSTQHEIVTVWVLG